MKKMNLFLIASLMLSSCASQFQPEHAENPKLICSVYDAAFGSCSESIAQGDMFSSAIYEFAGAFGVHPKSSYTNEQKMKCVRVVESEWDDYGDNYDIYLVIYEIDLSSELKAGRVYALVALTEFENGNIEWETMTVESTLLGVKALLE